MPQSYRFIFDNPSTITHNSNLVRFDSLTAFLIDLTRDGMFCAKYGTDINATWGGGSPTGTPNGGASVSGGRLDLKGGTGKSVDYSAVTNANFRNLGTVRMDYIPNYTGAPAADRTLFAISKAAGAVENLIRLTHASTGNLVLLINDSTGALITSTILGAYSPTTGVKDEIEVDIDISAGATRVFVNGTQLGAAILATGSRDQQIQLLRIGQDELAANNSDAEIDNVVIFDVVKHTANYTVGADDEEIPDTQPGYSTRNPSLVLPGIFRATDILTFTSEVDKPAGTEIKFILEISGNKVWHNGHQWTVSDGTYTESNTGDEINTNVDSLILASPVRLTAFLHSDDGSAKPTIESVTVTFEIEVGEPTRPRTCLVYGWLVDQIGDPIVAGEVLATTDGFYHGAHAILATQRTTTTNENGYWELLLVESETLDLAPYSFRFRADVSAPPSITSDYVFPNVQVPDLESADFGTIAPLDTIYNPSGDPTDDEKLAAVYKIVLEQGSNFELTVTVKDSGGAPVDLTSVTEVEMDFRPNSRSKSTIMQISMTGGEITIPIPANGEIIISVDDAVISALRQGGYYDMELTDFLAAGKKKRLMEGPFVLTQETTR